MFIDAAGVDVKHIPYKGVGPMVADLIGGQVELGVVAVPAVQGHLKSGALRAIGVMGTQRVPSLPDVPTIAEQGFPDVDIAGWFAVIGPAKLPPAQVKRLHDAVVAAFASAECKAAMAKQENIIAPTTPEAAGQFFAQRAGALCEAREEGEHHGRVTHDETIPPWPSTVCASTRPRSRLRPTSRPKRR